MGGSRSSEALGIQENPMLRRASEQEGTGPGAESPAGNNSEHYPAEMAYENPVIMGANPMHGRERQVSGAAAKLGTV